MTQRPKNGNASLEATISRQEQRIHELEQRERLLNSLLESISVGVMAAISPDGTIQYVNTKTEELFGYARDELMGAASEMLFSAADRQLHKDHLSLRFDTQGSTKQSIAMELHGRSKKGSEFPIEVHLSFVRVDNQELVLAAIVDVAERQRLEEEILQKQKLESLGIMAGGVAHDFNNLLTAILGNAHLVKEKLPPYSSTYGRVDQIIQAGRHAADLTLQLLAYAGRAPFYITDIDLQALLTGVVNLVRSSVPAQIQINMDLPAELPHVTGDSGQLQQVFLSLIWNSVEAIGEQPGNVYVEACVVNTDAPIRGRFSSMEAAPGKYLRILVRDTGCGMDEATTSKIYDPFFSTKFTGRGLGLPAARGILKAHRGVIQVASVPGIGTTFTVHLPVPGGV